MGGGGKTEREPLRELIGQWTSQQLFKFGIIGAGGLDNVPDFLVGQPIAMTAALPFRDILLGNRIFVRIS